MARILWLADVLRAAGLTVVEHAGWRDRAASGEWDPRFGVVHATAAPRTQSDTTQVRIVRDGREGLPGPIANACVDRLGRWHVLAAGRCNTTLTGTAGPFAGLGNRYALGIEACNDNAGEPWPAGQREALIRGWAAISARLDWTAANLVGHKEHTPGHKSDPTFSMSVFRSAVTDQMEEEMTPAQFLALLGDPDVAAKLRALPWQLGGGGVPGGASSMLGAFGLLFSKVTGMSVTIEALAAALASGGTDVDTAAILRRIDDRAAEDAARDTAHAAHVEKLEATIADLRATIARGHRAEADAYGA